MSDQQLCQISNQLDKLLSYYESVRQVFITMPDNGLYRVFSVGKTLINFKTGAITNPDSSVNILSTTLDSYGLEYLHCIVIETTNDITVRFDSRSKRLIKSAYNTTISYINFSTIEIECTLESSIRLFVSTNPQANIVEVKTVLNRFIVISNNIQYSSDVDSYGGGSWSLIKSMDLVENYSGSIRIVFDMRTDGAQGDPHAQLHRNGSAFGGDHTVHGVTDFTTFSEDFTNIRLLAGDRIEIRGYVNSGYSNIVRNFRLEFDYI